MINMDQEMSRTPSLVRDVSEALDNVLRFAEEAAAHPALSQRAGTVHAWYALRDATGQWHFGPSKWVGYRNARAGAYLASSGKGGERSGGRSEAVLSQWFEPVDLSTVLGKQLHRELVALLGRWGKRPRNPIVINVLKSEMDQHRQAGPSTPLDNDGLSRIVADPDICGGRPVIRGTRVRVSDLIDMMALGASRDDILADYPYLTDADLSAALSYAARATTHLVIKAA